MTKFLCDQMCGELGRWLRAAGYDTAIVKTSLDDREIYERAKKENRFLITHDQDFTELDPEGKTVIYLKGEVLKEWVEQLKEWGVDWLFYPFSRCLQCNSPFHPVPPPQDLPEGVPVDVDEFWSCPECDQLFWLGSHTDHMESQLKTWRGAASLTLGIGGDLMIGRLVNKQLAISPPSYVWGNLHPIMQQMDLNLANLETTLTRSEKIVPKVFNFKADPEKVAALTEAPIHIVNIANNHILDFDVEGLLETVETLDRAKILHIGAGKNLDEARAPCIIEKNGIKLGFLGCTDNEPSWVASSSIPGTNYLEVGDLEPLRESILSLRQQVDILILSIHWGPNMQKRPTPLFQSYAHDLIDLGVDILHGHSAHVFQGVEVYKGKLILYDTGELVDDYAVDPYLRNDRSFYFVVKMEKKRLISLRMIPTLISGFQVNIADDQDQLDEMELLSREFKTKFNRSHNELFIFL